MFRLIPTFAAVALIGGLTLSASATTDVAVNGDFETGDFTGWTEFLSPDASIVSDDPFEGSFNAKIDNQSPTSGAIMKNSNVGIGTAFANAPVEVKFWARGSADVGGVHFAELFSELAGGGTSKTEILGGGGLFGTNPDGTIDVPEWTEFTFNTTLGNDVGGGVTLQFNAATGPNPGTVLEVDDVSISVIPEPASLTLLGLGSLAALGRRRRNR